MNSLEQSKRMKEAGKEYLFEATPYILPILERGKGSYVWDVDGNRYFDLNAGQFCMTFGHSYQPFVERVKTQMEKIYHTNTSALTPEIFEAAEKIASITGPYLKKTIFLSTGSEANECALRYAKFITGKNGVIALDKGYHGLTLAAQAATMGGQWARPAVSRVESVLTPDFLHAETDKTEREFLRECILDLQQTFEAVGKSTAAMILEPVIGVGGMSIISEEYLREVRRLCDIYRVLLIFDECQCGFGRSGQWFVYQRAGIVPDILVTAKAMGMGLAVSAVTFSQETAECMEGKITHFSSHQNDPLSAAVVSFVIDEIRDKNLLEQNREKGAYLLECLKEACDTTDILCNPRGLGLMCAFDLNERKIRDYRDCSRTFIRTMQKNGVLIQAIRQGRTFRIMPNYFVERRDMEFLKESIKKTVREMSLK